MLTTTIHFDQLVFALFENTFSYISNIFTITKIINFTSLKLNKSVEFHFHRGYILHYFFGEVNSFFQEPPKKV